MSHSGSDEKGKKHLAWFSGEDRGTGQNPGMKGIEAPISFSVSSQYDHGLRFHVVWLPAIGKADIR